MTYGRSRAITIGGNGNGKGFKVRVPGMEHVANLEAEKKVLGAMIRDPESITQVSDYLDANDFFHPPHQIIYKAIIEIHFQGTPVDLVVLGESLERKGELELAGGASYIAQLPFSVASSVNIHYHSQIIRENAIRRHIIYEAMKDIDLAPTEEISHLSGRFLRRFQGLQNCLPGTGAFHVGQILPDVIQKTEAMVQEAMEGKPARKAVTTGLVDLDRFTGGMDRGEMIVLAARPSEGKTALACRIAYEAAQNDYPVLFFSLETSKEILIQRTLCGLAQISIQDLVEGRVQTSAIERIQEARKKLEKIPLYVDDGSGNPNGRNVESILARCERFKLLHPETGLIIIDYLQLMRNQSRNTYASRYEQITEISNHCQSLPLRMNCPLLLLSQLSRDVEKEKRNEPRMSDLRDSGAIEQDAHQIWFLSREPKVALGEIGPRNLTVAKNKNGKTGKLKLQFMPQYLWFENYSLGEESNWMDEEEEWNPF